MKNWFKTAPARGHKGFLSMPGKRGGGPFKAKRNNFINLLPNESISTSCRHLIGCVIRDRMLLVDEDKGYIDLNY